LRRYMHYSDDPIGRSQLKSDLMARWVETDWLSRYPQHQLLTLWTTHNALDSDVMQRYDRDFLLTDGFRLSSIAPVECPVVVRIHAPDDEGKLTYKTGAYLYTFTNETTSVEILIMGAYFSDQYWYRLTLAVVPDTFIDAWTVFTKEVNRFPALARP
jgi:hypothetical protein